MVHISSHPTLTTARLDLRLLGPDHAIDVTRYLARNRDYFKTAGPLVDDDYFTDGYQRRRLARELEAIDDGSLFRLWIYLRSSSNPGPIGDVSLSRIVRGIMQSCFLGYKIDRAHAGNGYMTEALEATVAFAFEKLGLHRLEANIMPSNAASVRVVEKLGFVDEGCSRRYLLINGAWEDHRRFAIVNDKWSDAASAVQA